MPIARKIPKPAGRFWLCSVIRTKYDNTINRHYPAWFPHGYYLTFSSLCHCTIYVIARRSPFSVIILFLSLPDIFPFLSLPDLIGQSTTLCLVFQMPRSSRSMTTTKAITFLFMSLPDILPFLSLPDLIGQSTTLCLVFQILRSSRSMTTTKAITFLFVSFSDIFPFLSLPDLIGQSIIFYLVFGDTPVMRSEYLTCKIKIIF